MPRVFIEAGSNIDPERNVREALHFLAKEVCIISVSTFYCTEPEGAPGQPAFYNGVIEVETDISPLVLKYSILRKIEDQLGRVRSWDKNAPRPIDLDILVYGDVVANSDGLLIPDPQIAHRPFLAVPLAELAPDLILPESGISMEEIAARFEDHNMAPLSEFTEVLRRDFGYEPGTC